METVAITIVMLNNVQLILHLPNVRVALRIMLLPEAHLEEAAVAAQVLRGHPGAETNFTNKFFLYEESILHSHSIVFT